MTELLSLSRGEDIDFYYLTTPEQVVASLPLLNSKLLAMDTEVRVLFEYGEQASWKDPHTSQIRLLQVNTPTSPYPLIYDVLLIGIPGMQPLIDLLMDPSIRKVLHNATYDLKQIRSTFGVWLPNVWCTLLMAQRIGVCTGFRAAQMRGNSYKAIARDYFGITISKLEQTSDWSTYHLTPSQLEYAALDVGAPRDSGITSILLSAYELFLSLLSQPYPNGYDVLAAIELDQQVNLYLAQMEYRGMPISTQILDLIYNQARTKLKESQVYLCNTFKLPILQTLCCNDLGEMDVEVVLPEQTQKTLNNSTKLLKLVNSTLAHQGVKLSDMRAESLKEVLKQLEQEELEEDIQPEIEWGIEVIDKLIEFKVLSKMVSIDYRKLINPVTGRIHPSFNCIGASTGRMSSGGGSHTFNAQQISQKALVVSYPTHLDPYHCGEEGDTIITEKVNLRHAFVPDQPGTLIASADFSSQELAIAAALSNDPRIIDSLLLAHKYRIGTKPFPTHEGKPYSDPLVDLHIVAATFLDKEVARIVKEEPWNANKDNPLIAKYRQLGKILNYALIYLASASTLAKQMGCTKEEAQEHIDRYFSLDGFYHLKVWLDSTALVGKLLRWIRTITGDLIFINEENSKGKDGADRKAVNASIQGLAATQTKYAIPHVDRLFKELDLKYRDILGDRRGEIIAPVHDELVATIPGACTFRLVYDEEAGLYKRKTTFDKSILEHQMALDYTNAMVQGMELGQLQVYSLLNSPVPPASDCKASMFWVH